MKDKPDIDQSKLVMKGGQHFIFWIIAYLFFILFFGRANRDYHTTIIFTSMLFPLAMVTGYFLNYYLIPKYLDTSKYWRFALFLFYTLVFTLWSEVMISLFVFVTVSDFHLSRLDPASFDVVFLLVGLYFIITGFIAIEQVKRAFQMKKENTRLEKIHIETELKLRESELKLLRAQLNPHFLFNTLNNLYGLTMEKSDLAPELVLKLSDLMDYMLYRCNKAKVSLKSEAEHLQNYMGIERIRYGEKLRIEFRTEGDFNELEIAPMLLLVFVENAFKHGAGKSIGHPFVHIFLKAESNELHLTVKNSYQPHTSANEEDRAKGIGLENARKRLQLIYPDKHQLEIRSSNHSYEINLRLILDRIPLTLTENKWTN